MASYICCYCGKKTASPSGGSCSYSPHKSHEFISADGRKDFTCSYCGKKPQIQVAVLVLAVRTKRINLSNIDKFMIY